MNEKLKNIEEENFRKTSGGFTGPFEEEHPSSPRFRNKDEPVGFGGAPVMGRQRMDPGYII